MRWPLVGRGEELDAAVEAVTGGRGVVLAGAAGVGKTRLGREVVGRVAARGWVGCWARATAAAQPIPFGAFAHLLPSSLPAGAGRVNLLRAAEQELVGRVGGSSRGLVVGVDDAHLLDGHSAALLGVLVAGGRARVLATVRTGQACADAVTALWKDGGCVRVEVQALSRGEVAALLEAVLDAPAGGATVQRLWAACAGNCLVLSELVAGGLEAGVLAARGGVWRWRGPLVTARLSDLVQARLGGLSGAQRRVGEVVALAAPVGAAVLEQVTEPGAVQTAQRSGVVVEQTEGRRQVAHLGHPVYGEVLRDQLPPAAARQICSQLAATVEAYGARRRGDLLRVATWRLQAGDTADPDLFTRAARAALGLLDHDLAHRLAAAAADAGAGFDADYLRAETLIGLGEFTAADDLLAGLQTTAPTHAQQATVAQTRAMNLCIGLGRPQVALSVLEETETSITDPNLAAELAANRAYLMVTNGNPPKGTALAKRVLGASDLSERCLTTATASAALGLLYDGQVEQAVGFLDALELRDAAHDLFAREFGLEVCWFFARLLAGDLEDAATRAQTAYQRSVSQVGAPLWVTAVWATAAGLARRIQGRPATARRWLEEGISLLDDGDVAGYLGFSLAELAHCHALQGHATTAHQLTDKQEARPASMEWQQGYVVEARVWTVAARGEASRATELALTQAIELGTMGLRFSQAAVLHQAARLGAADRAVGSLATLAAQCDAEVISAAAEHAAALAEADPDGLLAVCERFEHMGAWLYAAEAAAQAAPLWRRAGRRGSALTAAARARRLADRCEGAHTPALVGLGQPLPITAREREVAGLAARGLTNQQIAQRLCVSQRTVHNHLTHVYSKLGITGRDQLAALLLPHGASPEPAPPGPTAAGSR